MSDIPERVRLIVGPLHVTPQAVSLMLTRHRRSLKSLREAMVSSLSAHAANVLGRHGIRTREQARQGNVLERLADGRNCGRKTMDEIARWVEQEEKDLTAPETPGVERTA